MKKIFTLFFILNSLFSYAQFSNDPDYNFEIRDSIGVNEDFPICVLNPDFGMTFTTYFNFNSSGTYDYSMQVIDENGYKQLPNSGHTISHYPQTPSFSNLPYDTKIDHDNNIITAIPDLRNGTGWGVFAYKTNLYGDPLWGNSGIPLTIPSANNDGAPSIAISSNNDVIIAWESSYSKIKIQKISPSGSFIWTSPKVIEDTVNNNIWFTYPQVLSLSNNEFMLVYLKKENNGSPYIYNLYMQRFDPNGDPIWINPVLLSTRDINNDYYEKICLISDLNNGAYVAYSSERAGNPTGHYDIYLQHIDENGNLWSTDGSSPGSSGGYYNYYYPVILFESGMSGPALGMSAYEDHPLWYRNKIVLQYFDTAGNRRGNYLQYDGFEFCDMKKTSDGLIILYTTHGELKAMKMDENGNLLWSYLPVSNHHTRFGQTKLTPAFYTSSGVERVVAVWNDQRNDNGIYAQNINNNGTLGLTIDIPEINDQEFNLSVFPNPSLQNEQFISIDSKFNDLVNLKIVDLSGKVIVSRDALKLFIRKNTFSLNELSPDFKLPKGFYTAVITGSKSINTAKFIIQ